MTIWHGGAFEEINLLPVRLLVSIGMDLKESLQAGQGGARQCGDTAGGWRQGRTADFIVGKLREHHAAVADTFAGRERGHPSVGPRGQPPQPLVPAPVHCHAG